MIDAEETKRRKAKELRYRKPLVRDINLDYIRYDIDDIACECDNVRYWTDTDDETLINALDGDEDEAYEFKMMFCDLSNDCESLQEDLHSNYCSYIPECFDLFFVAIGAGGWDGMLGYDEYEGDYFGLDSSFEERIAQEESAKKLKRLTKDELIMAAMQCFKIYHSYLGVKHRYDCLKASIDILKDKNTGYLQVVKQIEEVYERANRDNFSEYENSTRELDKLLKCMPQEAWLA